MGKHATMFKCLPVLSRVYRGSKQADEEEDEVHVSSGDVLLTLQSENLGFHRLICNPVLTKVLYSQG